ncbi:Glutathione S-transferase [Alternaria alternata]|nr:Glutathione S-transferase [Alternaria alternata]
MLAMVQNDTGEFRRKTSQFRSVIPSAQYPAEAGRYVLYMNNLCPWVHRTLIVRSLKHLDDIIETIEVDSYAPGRGWTFSGKYGPDRDPITSLKTMPEVYEKHHPGCLANGIASVPVLFDKKTNTIVNNESSEIIRMFYTTSASIVPPNATPTLDLLPADLKDEIEAMNTWVYEQVNNGTYRVGFATSPQAYSAGVERFYDGLGRLETHLSDPAHRPYLFGTRLTEADVRLFPTIVRFDIGYVGFFNRRPGDAKFIRDWYPNVDKWLRTLYWDESVETSGAFKKSVDFSKMREGVAKVEGIDNDFKLPDIDILPLESVA